MNNSPNSLVSHCVSFKHTYSKHVSPNRLSFSPTGSSLLFHIYLIFPYQANTKCLWHETMETVMGGRNHCIGPASVSFSIYLNMHWCCIVAKNHTGYVHERLRVLVPLGGVPSASHRTVSTDWPKYIVLSSSGTFTLWKWFVYHEQLITRLNALLCLL